MASREMRELLAELAEEKEATRQRLLSLRRRFEATSAPSPCWSLPNPRFRYRPNSETGKARSNDLMGKNE